MNELVGHICEIYFVGETHTWPIPGAPAHAWVRALDMRMVKFQGLHNDHTIWVNVSQIKTIRSVK